ncbi:hypothetical protein J2W30_002814 [Variovorax boronicumulans]|uniref:hypothetical protein n=1 Tax=Variovorax boronicumulans TaxID=436515 RepID=UPI002788FCCD|nr:hypothetical protein [Variovorax boronicumulans]MDQ0035049.1 hypothetical protein [Variovorax boronicumulans]
MSIDCTHLDALLLESIERIPKTFAELRAEFESEFNKHAKPNRYGDENGWRLIDRRLQALRKAGHIKFNSKLGWSASSIGRSGERGGEV